MNQFKDQHAPHLFVLGAGAIGDTISAIPAMRYAAKHIFDPRNLRVMIPRELRELFDFLPDENLYFFGVEGQQIGQDWVVIRQYDQIPNTLHPSAIPSPMRMSLTDYAAMKFLGMLLPPEEYQYPSPNLSHIDIDQFGLPEKYACILVTNLNKNRSLPFRTSDKLAKYFLNKGITPIYMGKNTKIRDTFNQMDTESESPKAPWGAMDLVDKTSLMEAAKIMGGAQIVVGADTGLIHLAACTDVPIVCGYTTVAPHLRIPVRHGEFGWKFKSVTPPGSSCQFCASELHRYDVNFNKCMRTDMQCVQTGLTPENFIFGIELVMSF